MGSQVGIIDSLSLQAISTPRNTLKTLHLLKILSQTPFYIITLSLSFSVTCLVNSYSSQRFLLRSHFPSTFWVERWYSKTARSTDYEFRLLRSKSWLYHLLNCVTLGRLPKCSALHFPPLENRNSNGTYQRITVNSAELTYVNHYLPCTVQ